ncbi:MAG: PaaI family thioesterase [Myxococcota bacterium]
MSRTSPPGDPEELPGQAEFTREMGIEMLGPSDDGFVLELELGPKHMSRAERAHGGVLFTMLDTALGRAVLSRLPEGRGCATVEIKVNYFRPVQSGRIRAVGRVREITKSLGYAEGHVESAEGKVLARASGTFFLTRTLRQQERERI